MGSGSYRSCSTTTISRSSSSSIGRDMFTRTRDTSTRAPACCSPTARASVSLPSGTAVTAPAIYSATSVSTSTLSPFLRFHLPLPHLRHHIPRFFPLPVPLPLCLRRFRSAAPPKSERKFVRGVCELEREQHQHHAGKRARGGISARIGAGTCGGAAIGGGGAAAAAATALEVCFYCRSTRRHVDGLTWEYVPHGEPRRAARHARVAVVNDTLSADVARRHLIHAAAAARGSCRVSQNVEMRHVPMRRIRRMSRRLPRRKLRRPQMRFRFSYTCLL
ncbi:unnamed protein product [Closterium sp. NIES-54]